MAKYASYIWVINWYYLWFWDIVNISLIFNFLDSLFLSKIKIRDHRSWLWLIIVKVFILIISVFIFVILSFIISWRIITLAFIFRKWRLRGLNNVAGDCRFRLFIVDIAYKCSKDGFVLAGSNDMAVFHEKGSRFWRLYHRWKILRLEVG
jgi:hypothetical protein